jgi:hypothetical protein
MSIYNITYSWSIIESTPAHVLRDKAGYDFSLQILRSEMIVVFK